MNRSLWVAAALALCACESDPTEAELETAIAEARAVDRGRMIFDDRCVRCHSAEAQRRNPDARDALPIEEADWHESMTAVEIYRAIRYGVDDTSMPAWRNAQRQMLIDLVAYIKQRR